ncbi:hypothetical protein NPIL_84311 [Nephila pilipes]|uniref:Uncharacterized protein n=1 Tax=Nephila pilipes TaxID=299642 RepID=A0A8X6UFW1_NEPPI|nr:hypothetical protein NPIL_84311 [Nephila pilipes]
MSTTLRFWMSEAVNGKRLKVMMKCTFAWIIGLILKLAVLAIILEVQSQLGRDSLEYRRGIPVAGVSASCPGSARLPLHETQRVESVIMIKSLSSSSQLVVAWCEAPTKVMMSTATFPPPRHDIVPPPHQPIPLNTFHALYYDATRQAYVQHAFAVLDVMRAEWKKGLQKMIMLPFTHG